MLKSTFSAAGIGLVLAVIVTSSAHGQTTDATQGQGAFKVGAGVSAPRAINAPDPEYSEDARRAGYECTGVLWLVVGPDGLPRDIRVARSCALGLDEASIAAVKTWTFEPSRKDGRPVPVQINVEVSFHLGDRPNLKALIKRANKGDALAKLQLSNLYFQGKPGVPQDVALGQEWQQKAANAGQPLAQFLLARRLEDEDVVAAYLWYSLSNKNGYDPAGGALARLAPKMSPEQLADAQARIENWNGAQR